MRVDFRSPQPAGASLRGRASRRIRALLRRLHSYVRSVRVRLEDVNGPLPGVDKRCQVRAHLVDGRVARVDATSRHWAESVDLATARLRQRVVMQLHRLAIAQHGGSLVLEGRDGARRTPRLAAACRGHGARR